MSTKRKATMAQEPAKRPRLSNGDGGNEDKSSASCEKPRNHPLYGQKNAFPGLDAGGDELNYDDGEPDNVYEYLRAVRSEANALPALMTAKTSNPAANPAPNVNAPKSKKESLPPGFFDQEQAYVAPVTHKNTDAAPKDPYSEAQASYNTLLRHRFILLRSTLKCTPPATAIAALDSAHPISLPRKAEAARKEWRRLVMSVEPQMVQLACMDMDSVLGVMQIMARMMSDVLRSEDSVQIRRIGAWAWGLLGKCRDIGELSTEEVGDIRDIGKRAVKILHKIQEADKQQSEDDEASDLDEGEYQPPEAGQEGDTGAQAEGGKDQNDEEQKPETGGAQTDDLEAAKARLQAKFQDSMDGDVDEKAEYVADATRAMLDMIIMVVGEFFGQRDLLESREIWVTAV